MFYFYKLSLAAEGFCERENELYFFSQNTLYRVGGTTDDGESIRASWESGPLDFSDSTKYKSVFQMALYGQVKTETEVLLTVETENEEGRQEKSIFFPSKKEFSLGEVRLMLRRAHIVHIRAESRGEGEFLLRSVRFKGRITDKMSE